MKCSKCHRELNPGEKFCRYCGAPVPTQAEEPYTSDIPEPGPEVCPYCGSPVKAGQKFCIGCGRQLVNDEEGSFLPYEPDYPEYEYEDENLNDEREYSGGKLKIILVIAIIIVVIAVAVVAFLLFKTVGGDESSTRSGEEEITREYSDKSSTRSGEEEGTREYTDESSSEAEPASDADAGVIPETETATEAASTAEGTVTETEPSAAPQTEAASTLIEMDYVGADTVNYPVTTDAFTTVSDPSGDFTFMYPMNFFETGYYDSSNGNYTFATADGDMVMTLTRQDAPYQNDPLASAEYMQNQHVGEYDQSDSMFYKFDSGKVSDDGYSRTILSGLMLSGSGGAYYCFVCNNTTAYTLKLKYMANSASDVENTPKGYLIDCMYRGFSISGTSYKLRSYSEYLAGDMGSKK